MSIIRMKMRQSSSVFGHLKDGRRNRLPHQNRCLYTGKNLIKMSGFPR